MDTWCAATFSHSAACLCVLVTRSFTAKKLKENTDFQLAEVQFHQVCLLWTTLWGSAPHSLWSTRRVSISLPSGCQKAAQYDFSMSPTMHSECFYARSEVIAPSAMEEQGSPSSVAGSMSVRHLPLNWVLLCPAGLCVSLPQILPAVGCEHSTASDAQRVPT